MENEELLDRIEKHFHSHEKKHHTDPNRLIIPGLRIKNYEIPSSGVLDDSRVYVPDQDYVWDITRITASGFSNGTVSVYYNNIADDIIFEFPEAGTYLPGPKQIWVTGPTDRLVFQSADLTGNAFISVGYTAVHLSKLAEYAHG